MRSEVGMTRKPSTPCLFWLSLQLPQPGVEVFWRRQVSLVTLIFPLEETDILHIILGVILIQQYRGFKRRRPSSRGPFLFPSRYCFCVLDLDEIKTSLNKTHVLFWLDRRLSVSKLEVSKALYLKKWRPNGQTEPVTLLEKCLYWLTNRSQ